MTIVKPARDDNSVGMPIQLWSLALVAVLPLHAAAQSRWKEIGKTSTGNSVYVDPRSVKKANGIITARVRVKFTKPVEQPKGPAWVSSQHIAMFDCAKATIASKETVYYADAAGTKVIEKKTIGIPGYGPAIGGSMSKVALDYFCKT
jgi:hypothetical protein